MLIYAFMYIPRANLYFSPPLEVPFSQSKVFVCGIWVFSQLTLCHCPPWPADYIFFWLGYCGNLPFCAFHFCSAEFRKVSFSYLPEHLYFYSSYTPLVNFTGDFMMKLELNPSHQFLIISMVAVL